METTSIAVIAVSNPSITNPFSFRFFHIPPWIIYLSTGLAVAAVLIVVTILLLEQRKRKNR